MKLFSLQISDINKNTGFRSTRVLKNTVSQLALNNKYSLTDPNSRNIVKSITTLSNSSGKKIIEFLLSTAEKLKYSTNIKLKNNPINDWKSILLNAAEKVLSRTPLTNYEKFNEQIQKLRSNKDLNDTEKEILDLRKDLIKSVNLKQIKKETVGGIKDFEQNLDYFIISSETTLEHKKYVLERLNYLMSDDYEINEQLKDKKSIVAAELVNDIAIYTPGHKVPNIKAVNQKQHGMCAAISIVRKKIAYEDKPNYIDSILSELDNSGYIHVYDRSNLGSGKKTILEKVPVDFAAAISKGYRIIDASATQWMQIASQTGYSGNSLNNYTPFDKKNFDINADSFFNARFEDSELHDLQVYYQALIKACDIINEYKVSEIKRMLDKNYSKQNFEKDIKAMQDLKQVLKYSIEYFNVTHQYSPKLNPKLLSDKEVNTIVNNLINLEKKYSCDISPNDRYSYIANEEDLSKKNKIKNYLKDNGLPEECINENILNRIYEAVNSYNLFKKILTDSKSDYRGLTKAKYLYEIGASTRYQFVQGLKNEVTLNYMMKKEHIPNKEQCVIDMADKLLEKISEDEKGADFIINSLIKNTDGAVANKEDAINLLEDIKLRVGVIINDEINNIYDSIKLHDKTEALIQYLESLQLKIANEADTNVMSTVAERFGLKKSPEKMLASLEEIKKGLISNKYTYEDIFNKIGASSQLIFLENKVNEMFDKTSDEDIRMMLNSQALDENVESEDLDGAYNDKLNQILNTIGAFKDEIDVYVGLIKVTDSQNNVIYSAEPADILIKKLENNHTIPSEKALKELQNHFDSIQKNRSADEFNSRRGKLSYKTLYNFSKNEQYTLSSIKRNITPVSRYLNKQLSYVQEYIKTPLEELKRMIGLDIGSWWVTKEGESGLNNGQDIRILEYITGRPHYITDDLKKAVEEIKTKPYSGISTSSVYHNKIGMHAQYIADIEPVKIKDSKGIDKEADVLFQDNTWGATEHENVWTDSYGLKRTDYSDYRGGTLGYITNDKFRNGNLVNRVLNDMVLEEEQEDIESKAYKKIRKDYNSTYNLPQYNKIVLDGESDEPKDFADSLYDTIFTPTSKLIDTMKVLTKDMSAEDIKNRLYSISNFKNNWQNISENILRRALSKEEGNFIIGNEEDYKKLPDTDTMKIVFEKAALMNNYPIEDLRMNLAKITNVSELDRYKKIQKQRAIKDFEYSFGKSITILDYLIDTFNDNDDKLLEVFLKKHNITLSDKEFAKIFYTLELDPETFDGSVKHTINQFTDFVYSKIADKITSFEQEKELKTILNNMYAKKLYFNKTDINTPEIQHIIKFIDRMYNPADDTELIKIFRRFQDLTQKEFDEQVISSLTDTDLNIKNKTGYDVLKEIQRYEEKAENTINNLIYADEIKNKTENSKPYNKYTNNKLYRKAKVLSKYTFDSAYRSMKNDLGLLKLDKLFDKYKGANLNKYGAYPAYPKVDYMPESVINAIKDAFVIPLKNEIEQVNAYYDLREYYELSDKLKQFAHKHNGNSVLTEKEYTELNEILGKICTLSYNDDSQAIVNEAAQNALEIEPGQLFKKYRQDISAIVNMIEGYKKSVSFKTIEQNINSDKSLISKQQEMLVNTYIRTRYQNRFYQTLNNYKKHLIDHKKDSDGNYLSDVYYDQLIEEIEKYNVLTEPVELLQRYIESLAKDSKLNKFSQSIENMLKRALDFAKLCDIQSTIMDAINSGVETDVKRAFDNIKITLNNGANVPMSTDRIIADYLVHSLVLDEDETTVLFLLDKLGLSETYVNYVCNDFDYDDLKTIITDAAADFANYKNYTTVFDKAYKELINKIDKCESPIKRLDEFKKIMSKAAKKYSITKSHARIFLGAADLSKEALNENPSLGAQNAITAIFSEAAKEFNKFVAEHLNVSNDLFDTNESIMHIVNNVLLKKDSKAFKNRERVNKKYNELITYHNYLFDSLQAVE